MSLFDSEEIKIYKIHIMNFINLVISYVYINKREYEFLYEISLQWGLSPNKLQVILINLHKIKFAPPKNNQIETISSLI
jgi:hypothetical protein